MPAVRSGGRASVSELGDIMSISRREAPFASLPVPGEVSIPQASDPAHGVKGRLMNQISVRGEVIAVPKMCCCCGDPKAKKWFKVAGSRIGRWIDTHYRDKRWVYFPLCKRCHQWIRAHRAAWRWFVVFLGSLVVGILAALTAIAGGLKTTGGLVVAAVAGGLLVLAVLAVLLWRLRGAQARDLDPGPPCTPQPVVLTDWLRNKHTFQFSHEGFFVQFRTLNQDNLG
jgi:hypothetical protein